MKIESLAGTVQQAEQLQKENGVPLEFAGPWYHGTRNKSLQRFDNKGPRVTWLTRSPAGGISWGPRVLTVYVVIPLDEPGLTDAGAGDDGGCDPKIPTLKLPNWWLKVRSAEVDHLMVISTCNKDEMPEPDLKKSLSDKFYLDLRRRLSAPSQEPRE